MFQTSPARRNQRRTLFVGFMSLALTSCGSAPLPHGAREASRAELRAAMRSLVRNCERREPPLPADETFETPQVFVEMLLVELPEGPSTVEGKDLPGAIVEANGAHLLDAPHALTPLDEPTRVDPKLLVISSQSPRLRFAEARVTPRLRTPIDLVLDVELTLDYSENGEQRRVVTLGNTFAVSDRQASHVILPLPETLGHLFLGVRGYVVRSSADLRDRFRCGIDEERVELGSPTKRP